MDTAPLIIGAIACISMILGYMPQAIATIRTRNTEGFSLTAWLFMAVGCFSFVAQGIITGNHPLTITNVITGTCTVIVLAMIIRNRRAKRRK